MQQMHVQQDLAAYLADTPAQLEPLDTIVKVCLIKEKHALHVK
jgi:hypothetical protein